MPALRPPLWSAASGRSDRPVYRPGRANARSAGPGRVDPLRPRASYSGSPRHSCGRPRRHGPATGPRQPGSCPAASWWYRRSWWPPRRSGSGWLALAMEPDRGHLSEKCERNVTSSQTPVGASEVGERFGCSATDSVHQQLVRGGGMRRIPADSTDYSLAALGKLQHIRLITLIADPQILTISLPQGQGTRTAR